MTDARPAVLVLGAEGFIGTAIRRHLAPRARLLSVDLRPLTPIAARFPYGGVVPWERAFQVDLGDPAQVDRLWADLAPEHAGLGGVVMLAAYYDFLNRPDARYARLQAGLEHLLRLVGRDLPPDAPFVFASSMAGLAPTEPGHPLTADSPRLGAWAYPASKLAAERALLAADIPQPRVQLVLAGVYSDLCELVPLYQQIERVRSRSPEKYFLPAHPDRGLTYVHLDSVADAFVRALERLRGRPGLHRLLIGQGHPVTYREIHDRASLAFHGRRLPLLRIPAPVASAGAWLLAHAARLVGRRRFILPWMIRFAGEHFELDPAPALEALGWSDPRDLRQDLDRLLDVAAHHPRLWREINARRPW